MKSSARPAKERETATFYPLTRDQLRVSGIPVIRIAGGDATSLDLSQTTNSTAETRSEFDDKAEPQPNLERVADRWENENWAQISGEVLDTNQNEIPIEKNPVNSAENSNDSTSSGEQVPRYQGTEDPENWSKKAFRSQPKLPTEQEPESFLDQLSKAEITKPGEVLANSESPSSESRYSSAVPRPHFSAEKQSPPSQVVFLDQSQQLADEPAEKNFRSIKKRLENANYSEDEDRHNPDVQFAKTVSEHPVSEPASTKVPTTGRKKQIPFWADAGIQIALGLALVLSVFGFYSFITSSSNDRNTPIASEQNLQSPEPFAGNQSHPSRRSTAPNEAPLVNPQLRIAERLENR